MKRKKYMDDVDLNLSDDNDDTMDMPPKEVEGAVVKPVLFVVCMVVSVTNHYKGVKANMCKMLRSNSNLKNTAVFVITVVGDIFQLISISRLK